MSCDQLVFGVAASYIRRLGDGAIEALNEEAEIAYGRGDQEAADIWREIVSMAEELLSQRMAS